MAGEKSKKNSQLPASSSKGRKKSKSARGTTQTNKKVNPVLLSSGLVIIAAVVTMFLAFPMPEAYNTTFQIGEIADQAIKADRDLLLVDHKATELNRQEARRETPRVFNLDDQSVKIIQERIRRLFSIGRGIFKAPSVTAPIFISLESVEQPAEIEMARLRKSFHSAFQLSPADRSFNAFAQIRFSPESEKALIYLFSSIMNPGIVAEKTVLLDQTDSGIIVQRQSSGKEELVEDPSRFRSLEEARQLVREKTGLVGNQVDETLSPILKDLESNQIKAIATLARSVLQPNLTYDPQKTEAKRNHAASQVKTVLFLVKKNEIIVRDGERVDELARQKLEKLAPQIDRNWLPKASGYLILSLVIMVVLGVAGYTVFRSLRLKNRDILFMATILFINLLLAFSAVQVGEAMSRGWPDILQSAIWFLPPLAAGAMLSTIFLGPLPGVFFAVLSASLTALVFDSSLSLFIYSFLGSFAGLACVVRVRTQSQISKAGLLVGLVNMLIITGLSLMEQSFWSTDAILKLTAGLLSGILSGIIVSGLLPIYEIIFRYTTNMKLLELANLDQPVLRELMVQAPGTYHHSVIVGAMVEAASESIGANPLLAKVSAYYHDLGKMKKPLYFVENQGYGDNKHEKLAPSMSSLILISHVKDGVELARKNRLSKEIIDIIQQHHGTSLIAYFYQKAKDNRTEDQPEINIEDYRYPGPKPQTKEAGLVMLADAVEAASRSLSEPTPSRVQGLVQKLINNIFSDGQLDECELTLKDLHLIAKSFNKILTGIFHRRVAYPEPATKDKTAHAGIAKQSPKDAGDSDRQTKVERKEDLRRLGMS